MAITQDRADEREMDAFLRQAGIEGGLKGLLSRSFTDREEGLIQPALQRIADPAARKAMENGIANAFIEAHPGGNGSGKPNTLGQNFGAVSPDVQEAVLRLDGKYGGGRIAKALGKGRLKGAFDPSGEEVKIAVLGPAGPEVDVFHEELARAPDQVFSVRDIAAIMADRYIPDDHDGASRLMGYLTGYSAGLFVHALFGDAARQELCRQMPWIERFAETLAKDDLNWTLDAHYKLVDKIETEHGKFHVVSLPSHKLKPDTSLLRRSDEDPAAQEQKTSLARDPRLKKLHGLLVAGDQRGLAEFLLEMANNKGQALPRADWAREAVNSSGSLAGLDPKVREAIAKLTDFASPPDRYELYDLAQKAVEEQWAKVRAYLKQQEEERLAAALEKDPRLQELLNLVAARDQMGIAQFLIRVADDDSRALPDADAARSVVTLAYGGVGMEMGDDLSLALEGLTSHSNPANKDQLYTLAQLAVEALEAESGAGEVGEKPGPGPQGGGGGPVIPQP